MSVGAKFGGYFRSRRKGLRLTLREFCRRNGFDPGYVSRLERGIVLPPREAVSLESFAKALKLEPASADWSTFFELAAAETGRVPAHVVEDPAKLAKMFRKLRSRDSRQATWPIATNLLSWSGTPESRFTLPRLIRRLVHATVDTLTYVDIPAGEGVQRPGWDGLVETPAGNLWVPAGRSGWEMSVQQDPGTKAQGDFDKREGNEITFVFVTTRRYKDKKQWEDSHKASGKFRDVRLYDCDDLEQWLETAPAVSMWLAHLLGLRPEGVRNIDEHWKNLSSLSDPNLKPEVFLASRSEQKKQLLEWLGFDLKQNPDNPLWKGGVAGCLALEARSPSEAVDFVAACIADLKITQRDAIEARTLIVQRRDAWSTLCAGKNPLVLMPEPWLPVEVEMVAEAVRNGHQVLLFGPHFTNERAERIELPRPYRIDVENALVVSGFPEEDARRAASESGGSLTVLKRRLSRFPETDKPYWVSPPEAQKLIPLLLAGGWDDASEADHAAIEKLAGRSYAEVLFDAGAWLNKDDPPLVRVLTHWSLVSHEDAWDFVAPSITGAHLDRFEALALEVLEEEHPGFGLRPEERWKAGLLDRVPSYSHVLRTGLAESLSLLGAVRSSGLIQDAYGAANRVERMVSKLLGGEVTWRRWASLSRELPVLAEAAPGAFLDAVERDLRQPEPELVKLFIHGNESTFFMSCSHAGLLWALEILAWEPNHLMRAAAALAGLAKAEPPTKGWCNSPVSSLAQIFLPWRPQTTVSVEDRIRVLYKLSELFDGVAWQLLLAMLPPLFTQVSHNTCKPRWRDWALKWTPDVTHGDYWQQVDWCAGRLLELADSHADRWKEMIKNLKSFPSPAREQVLKRLKEFNPDAFDSQKRIEITDTLREEVYQHQAHSSSSWALPSNFVEQLDEARTRFEPHDPIARHRWLFAAFPRPLWPSSAGSAEDREKNVMDRRVEALREIYVAGGLPRVLELASQGAAPRWVGITLAKARLCDDAEVLPDCLVSIVESSRETAQWYCCARFTDEHWQWTARLPLNEWSPEQVGVFALALPFERKTWDLVERSGREAVETYWSRVRGFSELLTQDEVRYAVSMLLKNAGFERAVWVLLMALHSSCQVDRCLLFETLEAGVGVRQDDTSLWQRVGFNIQELFGRLQRNSDADERRLASLEWRYLGLLDGHGASPETLLRLLGRDPHLFSDLLTLIYRSKDEPPKPEEVPTEQQKRRAENAYSLLRLWKTVPGLGPNGVDADELARWVAAARKKCAETGRLDVCDAKIGELLANAPEESNGPSVAIRDLIEEIDSDALTKGFEVGIANLRGVYTKSMTEGGEQERNLAKKYTLFADECAIEWPKTATALRRVAERYELQARRADEELLERL